MEPGIVAAIAGVIGTVFGSATTYLNAKRKAKSDDLATLQKTVETLRSQCESLVVQQATLMQYTMQLQLDKEKLGKDIDLLQEEVHKLRAEVDRRDARVLSLESQMAICPVISGNGTCERSQRV